MPLVKTLSDRVNKYVAKYDSTVIKNRLTQVQAIAESRYMDATPFVVTVREFTRKILESNGIPAGLHATYYSFALRIAKLALKHSGDTLQKFVDGEKQMWTVAYGADPAVLDQIANLVIQAAE